MNNSELVAELANLVATNRFSQTRKACLSEFIGKQYNVWGMITRVSNTTGYSRRPELRKGKTITLVLSNSGTKLSIRCNRSRSISISEHKPSEQLSIRVTIIGYDDVRQHLQAEESDAIKLLDSVESNGSRTMVEDNLQPPEKSNKAHKLNESSPSDDPADQLLAELQQMQFESETLLADASTDINKAQSRNLPSVRPDSEGLAVVAPAQSGSLGAQNEQASISQSRQDDQKHDTPDVIHQKSVVVDNTTSSKKLDSDTFGKTSPELHAQKENIARSKKHEAIQHGVKTPRNELDRIRREVLSDHSNPIEQKVFSEIIAMETGVPVGKVREVQKQLWHAILSPSMFGREREIFNFFPFGDFRLMRNRDLVNMDFKSAPVATLAEHAAVEQYPHSKFNGSNAESIHPPIAAHAIRIAATVAPIVGLSPPVTYESDRSGTPLFALNASCPSPSCSANEMIARKDSVANRINGR